MLTRRLIRHITNAVLFDHTLPPLCLALPIPTASQTPSIAPAKIRNRQTRHSSTSSSSTRWRARQSRDQFARQAKVQGLKSRAAFKLLEIDSKYKLFRRGDTVVDLGYAPGSWSQVAVTKTSPGGRVVGIDVLPVQPPRGVSTIQGNFLSGEVQREVWAYVQDPERGRVRKRSVVARGEDDDEVEGERHVQEEERGYIDIERAAHLDTENGRTLGEGIEGAEEGKKLSLRQRDEAKGRVVDVVLSDMSDPWDQTTGLWVKSVSNPYRRMQNTSGIAFKDHAGSMDLCNAAISFCLSALRTGGNFVCKFYQGAEDKALEKRLKTLFEKVYREKPESSRAESKEAYFVALRRKELVERDDVFKA